MEAWWFEKNTLRLAREPLRRLGRAHLVFPAKVILWWALCKSKLRRDFEGMTLYLPVVHASRVNFYVALPPEPSVAYSWDSWGSSQGSQSSWSLSNKLFSHSCALWSGFLAVYFTRAREHLRAFANSVFSTYVHTSSENCLILKKLSIVTASEWPVIRNVVSYKTLSKRMYKHYSNTSNWPL